MTINQLRGIMMKRKLMLLLTLVLAFGLLLAGCGGGKSTSSNGKLELIKIGTQSPLSGPNAGMGEPLKMGAELAVIDNKERFEKLGFNIQLFPQDDQGDPAIGVSNAEMLVSDKDVLLLVGHLNSGVLRASAPKYETGKLPTISPANTAVDLTENDWTTFHRICARDDVQGPAGARFIKDDLGGKSVYIVHDKTAYGEGLSEAFQVEAEKIGLKVVGFEGQEETQRDFSALVNKIMSLKPDAIYFGGMFSQTAVLLKQAVERGYDGYFLSGDGSDEANFISIAGADNVKKAYVTSVAGDATLTEEGKKWTDRYNTHFGKAPNTYSVYGYDATLVALDALEKAINDNGGKKPTREQILKFVSATKDFKGVFSTVTFDEKGDNITSDVFVYSFAKGTYPGESVKTIPSH